MEKNEHSQYITHPELFLMVVQHLHGVYPPHGVSRPPKRGVESQLRVNVWAIDSYDSPNHGCLGEAGQTRLPKDRERFSQAVRIERGVY